MIIVHPETFTKTGTRTYTIGKGKKATEHSFETYSIEVTIDGDRRAIRAGINFAGEVNERIDLYDLAIRFSTGDKVWPGNACWWTKTGNVNNLRPNIDKRGHFSCVGFFEDFEAAPVRSLHNAVA